MLKSHYTWLRNLLIGIFLFSLCCFILTSLVWHNPYRTSYGIKNTAIPTMHVESGFNANYRNNDWTPIYVTINNDGPTFNGTLASRTFAGDTNAGSTNTSVLSQWIFEQAITIPTHSHKQFTLNVPRTLSYSLAHGFIVTLRDAQGQLISSQTTPPGSEIRPGDLLIGTLTGPEADFSALSKVFLPNQTNNITLTPLDAQSFPLSEAVLENFDILVLENFPTATLSSRQLTVLQTWVNQGGVLIEVGGPSWRRTLGPLPRTMLPVTIDGTTQLAAGTPLLPTDGPHAQSDTDPDDTLTTALPISISRVQRQNAFSTPETILAAQSEPLIVQARQGAGILCYLAFDPTTHPLSNWPETPTVWQKVLLHTLGNTLLVPTAAENYAIGPGQLLTRAGILSLLAPALPVIPWILIGLLVGYILLLGPMRLLILSKLTLPRWWSWRLVTSCILIMTLFAYGLIYSQKEAMLTSNSISLIQINQGSSTAHITTYTGLFLPGQSDFHLHIPDENLVQAVPETFLANTGAVGQRSNDQNTILTRPEATDINIHTQDFWALHPIITEQDSQFPGSLATQLTLQDTHLVGSITNTLQAALNDVYVLLPHSFVLIGQLAAGETKQINLPIQSVAPDVGENLADQIAAYRGLPISYFPTPTQKNTATTLQLHVALLSALSGGGSSYAACHGSCLTHAITSRGTLYITGGQLPNPDLKNDFDPLLVPGASATMIGWVDKQIGGQQNLSINSRQVPGQHINLIQMPLNLPLTGSLHVPLDFITGNVIDIQSYDVQALLPGFYSMATGNITFELTLPDITHMHIQNAEIAVPDLVAHPSDIGSGLSSNNSNIQIQLYNWNRAAWEKINLTQDTFTTTHLSTYAGPYGRILVEIASRNTAQIYFGKPSLALHGFASP